MQLRKRLVWGRGARLHVRRREIVLGAGGGRSVQVICAEGRSWRGGTVRGVGGHFGRVRRFHSSVIAVLLAVSVNGDAVGSRRSAPATRTIARTRHGHSVRGRKAIANTGARIGARTRNTARAIAPLPGSGSVIAGGMRLRRALQGLQRWTRRCRIHPCLQAFIGSSRQPPRGLERWMRGWWESLWYQPHTGQPGKVGKRGRGKGAAATAPGLPASEPPGPQRAL